MTRRSAIPLIIVAALVIGPLPASADQVWINDIQLNPSRYWNTTVTVTGQVVGAVPNPVGTTRGTYTLLDESSQTPITVRTDELPPLGRSYAITGVVLQDPQTGQLLIKELKRTAPGMANMIKYLLIAGAALFLILLVVFLVLLMRPPKREPVAPAATIAAAPATAAPPVSDYKTTKLPASEPGAAPSSDETQAFMSLGAEIVVEKGPDKGKEWPLHKQVTTIGRPGTRKNDIELSDNTVSKEQASITYDSASKQFSISNQSTTNPTMVNKNVISEPVGLDEESVVEMGRTALRFRRA